MKLTSEDLNETNSKSGRDIIWVVMLIVAIVSMIVSVVVLLIVQNRINKTKSELDVIISAISDNNLAIKESRIEVMQYEDSLNSIAKAIESNYDDIVGQIEDVESSLGNISESDYERAEMISHLLSENTEYKGIYDYLCSFIDRDIEDSEDMKNFLEKYSRKNEIEAEYLNR